MNQEDLYALREARQEALSLSGAIVLSIIDPRQGSHPLPSLSAVPLVWIDTGARPDLADLARVHRIEGAGTIETSWIFDFYQPERPVTFYLRCHLKTPVRVSFIVAFPLPQYAQLIAQVLAWRELVLFMCPPPSWITDALTDRLWAMGESRSWIAKFQALQGPLLLPPSAENELNEGLHISLEHPDLAEAFDFWLRLNNLQGRTAEK